MSPTKSPSGDKQAKGPEGTGGRIKESIVSPYPQSNSWIVTPFGSFSRFMVTR